MQTEQITLLYSHANATMLGSLLAALMLVVVFHTVTPPAILAIWASTYVAVIGLRFYIAQSYFSGGSQNRQPEHWHLVFVATLAIVGLLWGVTGIALIPPHIDEATALIYKSIAALFACVVAAGALPSYAVKLSASLVFAACCIVPMSAAFILFSRDPIHTVGFLMLIFLIFLSLLAVTLNRRMLVWIRTSIDHAQLLKQLEQEHIKVQKVNNELRMDLAQHKKTEEALRSEKGKVEKLAEQLKTLSSHDALTGIANRRHFDEALEYEWNRALRNGQPLSLVLGDIDYFKNYNDAYGHQKGDLCLKKISSTLNGFCRRSSDLCARYGGEEFAVILAETGAAAACKLAESMRAAVEALDIPHSTSEISQRVSISFGVVAVTPDRNMSTTQLIQLADTALYRAKASGRNTIISAGTHPASLNSVSG